MSAGPGDGPGDGPGGPGEAPRQGQGQRGRGRDLRGNAPLTVFARDLRDLREKADKTLAEVAEAANYASPSMSKVTSDSELCSRRPLLAYLKALGEDPGPWLARWERLDRMTPAQRTTEPGPPPDAEEVSGPDHGGGPAEPPATSLPLPAPPRGPMQAAGSPAPATSGPEPEEEGPVARAAGPGDPAGPPERYFRPPAAPGGPVRAAGSPVPPVSGPAPERYFRPPAAPGGPVRAAGSPVPPVSGPAPEKDAVVVLDAPSVPARSRYRRRLIAAGMATFLLAPAAGVGLLVWLYPEESTSQSSTPPATSQTASPTYSATPSPAPRPSTTPSPTPSNTPPAIQPMPPTTPSRSPDVTLGQCSDGKDFFIKVSTDNGDSYCTTKLGEVNVAIYGVRQIDVGDRRVMIEYQYYKDIPNSKTLDPGKSWNAATEQPFVSKFLPPPPPLYKVTQITVY
ncbi:MULTISPECIES: helix-turn-helix domain-containing protein [Streptomycetaceae]|uniref:helix-turn-helix domain-containing protein n=1 Tax=Streptomycetaceae TaxID=2062 RepID=UPI0009666D15|nr:helix-turn-helix transcriptional regulator [Streptomyces sp. CB02056]OKH97569.1 hypothetical protein AMK13_38410 [Streptomyces sp. CB02056]